MSRAEAVRERLLANLGLLMEDVEELVDATADRTDGGMSSLRERISRTLETVKNTLSQAKKIMNTSRRGAEAVMSYARDHRWARAVMTAAAAMAVACLLRTRCSDRERADSSS